MMEFSLLNFCSHFHFYWFFFLVSLIFFLEDKQYVAFGLSGAEKRTRMVGGDVVVAWMEHDTGKGFANDYYLDAKSQCAGQSGVCPDDVFEVSIEKSFF
jgi:hypothetical protein